MMFSLPNKTIIDKIEAESILEKLIWYKGHTKVYCVDNIVKIEQIIEEKTKYGFEIICGDEHEAEDLKLELVRIEQKIFQRHFY